LCRVCHRACALAIRGHDSGVRAAALGAIENFMPTRARCVRIDPSSTQLKGVGCSQFGVSDDDEFSHDCGDGDEGLFACVEEAFVEGAKGRVVFCGGDCGHEQDAFNFGSSAAGSSIGVGLAALIGMGRKACEGGGLASGERTELGHEGDEGGGGFLTDAGYGDEDIDGLGDRLAGGAEGVDVGLDRLDLRIEATSNSR
jgi:hypothetical protein